MAGNEPSARPLSPRVVASVAGLRGSRAVGRRRADERSGRCRYRGVQGELAHRSRPGRCRRGACRVGRPAFDLEHGDADDGTDLRADDLQLERVCGVSRDVGGDVMRRSFGRLSPASDPSQFRLPEMARTRADMAGNRRRHGRPDLDDPASRQSRLGAAAARLPLVPAPREAAAGRRLLLSEFPASARAAPGLRSRSGDRRRSFLSLPRPLLDAAADSHRARPLLHGWLGVGRLGRAGARRRLHDDALVHILFRAHARVAGLVGRWRGHPGL